MRIEREGGFRGKAATVIEPEVVIGYLKWIFTSEELARSIEDEAQATDAWIVWSGSCESSVGIERYHFRSEGIRSSPVKVFGSRFQPELGSCVNSAFSTADLNIHGQNTGRSAGGSLRKNTSIRLCELGHSLDTGLQLTHPTRRFGSRAGQPTQYNSTVV